MNIGREDMENAASCVQSAIRSYAKLNTIHIYETIEFKMRMQEIHRRDVKRRRRRSLPPPATREVKFEIKMADERNLDTGIDGSLLSDGAGGDAGNGHVSDANDGHLNSCGRRRPFLIGVAGGTASGKVQIDVLRMNLL